MTSFEHRVHEPWQVSFEPRVDSPVLCPLGMVFRPLARRLFSPLSWVGLQGLNPVLRQRDVPPVVTLVRCLVIAGLRIVVVRGMTSFRNRFDELSWNRCGLC